jgi:glycosyltransferase involved in cell wall biosynthesis
MKDLPLVSVIIPVFNAEKYVKNAIQSALNQTYKRIELLVINDGSTDRSPDIIKAFNDPHINIITQQNKGGSAARNAGILRAKGDYIKFLDADDELLPEAIETQVDQSLVLGENEIVFGDFNFINREGKSISPYKFNNTFELRQDPESYFLNNWKILISSPLHRKEYLENVGGFDEKLPFGQESDLHFRLTINDIRFVYREAKIFNYRSHLGPERISLKRVRNNKELSVIEFSLDKKIKLLLDKYGKLNEVQKNYFALGFWGLARKSFINEKTIQGKYYLSRSKQYSKYKIPPYKNNMALGIAYQVLGILLGFSRLEKNILRMKNKSSRNTGEQDVLFQE